MTDGIRIKGARTHNLKNIDVEIPRNKFTVITGLSGSGKSSLAFDTLYAEGQRRYVESLSSYARQFLSMMEKPDLDGISGLSPAIAIEQKATSHNPRSTVGTVTEIYDYLRLLFARVGEPKCPIHKKTLIAKTSAQMVDITLQLPEDSKWMILAPLVQDRKGEFKDLIQQMVAKGYVRARIDGQMYDLQDCPKLALRKKHTIEIVIDRFKIRPDISSRLLESFENALNLTSGLATLSSMENTQDYEDQLFSAHHACSDCGYTISELEPRLFSFNNPHGACPACTGLGLEHFIDPKRIVPNTDLSIYEGAIKGWENRGTYYYEALKSLAKQYRFDIKTPFKDLDAKIQDVIFYGARDFIGVIPYLHRKYRNEDHLHDPEKTNEFLSTKPCSACCGTRLGEKARNVYVEQYNISDICSWPIEESLLYFKKLNLLGSKGDIAEKINKELIERLSFLVDVGLSYLSLDRSAETLSGGESQRIRLASQIGSGLVGVMYILDEPSIGLHQRDNDKLLKTLLNLRDLGNTVIVVEHDEDAIKSADFIVDMGPGAGVNGGEVVGIGHPSELLKNEQSLTGQYLAKKLKIEIPTHRLQPNLEKIITLKGVECNNLSKVDVDLPVGLFTCITGVSGSGKSSLINDTLYPWAANFLNRANYHILGSVDFIIGLKHCDKVIAIDQSPIGRTPRSNAATYTGIFTIVRELFAATLESRSRGYGPGRFSFNVRGGRCESCQGDGLIKVEMHFLPDMYVPCDACQGSRYQKETLSILYKSKNIQQVLNMTVTDAREFFDAIPSVARKCQTLIDVGLGYIQLGQSATTLSGGEAQRIKLAKELSKRDTGNTLYILDEPTTGLHMHDVKQLLNVLFRLRDKGNTIVVIEHNLDVIKVADWIIDLGPEGGKHGGQIIAVGSPESVALEPQSYTGQFLKTVLAQ